MKIPFDIKYKPQIESGEYKVETRDGNPVRIICWDRKSDHYKIIALVTIEDEEIEFSYTEKGALLDSSTPQSKDLFIIIPEPKLTELERAIKRGMLCAGLEGVSTTIIKETAKEVKDIICKGCTVGLDQYWKGREDARKEYERPITYHYPIYQPPCFYGGVCTNPFKDCINCPRQSNDTTTTTTSGTCKNKD